MLALNPFRMARINPDKLFVAFSFSTKESISSKGGSQLETEKQQKHTEIKGCILGFKIINLNIGAKNKFSLILMNIKKDFKLLFTFSNVSGHLNILIVKVQAGVYLIIILDIKYSRTCILNKEFKTADWKE